METGINMDMLPLPDCPTQEERQGLKYTYPSEKWLYSGSEVEDNRYNSYKFHPLPSGLPNHIDAINLLVDSEQVAKAYGTVLQDWKTRFSHATDDMELDDNMVIEGEAEEDTTHTSNDFDPYIVLSGDESDIFSSGDDTYVFPSVDNDNDSGNES